MFVINYIVSGLRYGVSRCSHAYHSVKATTKNCLKPKTYKLVSKTEFLAEKNPMDFRFAPENAVRAKRVTIGKNNDENYYREIISYYDKENRIIERAQSGSDIGRLKRTYTYSSGYTIDNLPVNIRQVHTTKQGAINGRWRSIRDEQQYVYSQHRITPSKKVVDAKKLHITRTDYSTNGSLGRDITLTEYPMTHGIEPKSAKKLMNIGLIFAPENKMPSITYMSGSKNIKLPLNDEFLRFRFLVNEEKQEALAKYYLSKNGLLETNVGVGTDKTMVPDDSNALFDDYNGWIWFGRIVEEPVRTAAHEAEHALHHAIMGRAFGRTPYEQKCRNLYGPLDTRELQEEAQRLAQANAIYPAESRTPDGKIKKEYWDNYLEVTARKAGKKAQEAYEVGRDYIAKLFRCIPIKKYVSI